VIGISESQPEIALVDLARQYDEISGEIEEAALRVLASGKYILGLDHVACGVSDRIRFSRIRLGVLNGDKKGQRRRTGFQRGGGNRG
jgi:hypothetical protein